MTWKTWDTVFGTHCLYYARNQRYHKIPFVKQTQIILRFPAETFSRIYCTTAHIVTPSWITKNAPCWGLEARRERNQQCKVITDPAPPIVETSGGKFMHENNFYLFLLWFTALDLRMINETLINGRIFNNTSILERVVVLHYSIRWGLFSKQHGAGSLPSSWQ
jgi:hypothetical protein